ncbi:MAG: aryl-sulfate sulfotransferase [Deltaproteobacteria bacterium]|nr:aryl-sulfate sulfotransferase [Deltaproteobacteria bacterium]
MSWLWLLACAGSGDVQVTPPADTTETSPPPTDIVPTTETGTSTPEPPGPCESAAGLNVVSATVTQPWHENEARLDVVLSQSATVAVQCALSDDPTEIHLAESGIADTAHMLRLSGLLAEHTYDCLAAPVCPTQEGEPLAFVLETPAANPDLPRTRVEGVGGGTEYVLANNSDDCNWENQQLVVFDRDGRSRWWYQPPAWVGPSVEFRYHGMDRFEWGGGWEANANGRPRQVSLFDGEIYDSALAMPDFDTSEYHHDGKQLADGRLLTLEEVEVRAGGGDSFTGFQVRRIDPVTNLVDFTYDSQRAFDEGHLPRGDGDVWHANWVDIGTVNGAEVLAVSFCFLWEVGFIDVATGEWLGTFGEDGDFSLTDASGAPLGADGFSQCQHGLEFTGTELLVYDNGNGRGYSRASEYSVDLTTLDAVQNWTWTEPDWWETTLGDVDYLPSGNVLVGMGHADCFSSNPGDHTTIAEIDPFAGDRVWQLQYANSGDMAYRADFADACSLFANAKYCPAVGDRLTTLAPAF